MSNYIGVRCPVCNKKFTEADDIVVCPVCGAPHHRDCYTQNSQCAFAADHLAGKEWSDPAVQAPQEETAGVRMCGRCGATNPQESIFCQVCGHPLSLHQSSAPGEGGPAQWSFPGVQMQIDTISMAYGGLSPEEEIGGESVRDLARYIGSGSAYYLPRFRILGEHARSVIPNLSAMVFSFLYYFYRKMYKVAVFLLVLYVVSSIPTYLAAWESYPLTLQYLGFLPNAEVNQAAIDHLSRLGMVTQTIYFIIGVVVSVCANRFYFNRAIADVHAIRVKNEGRDYGELLASAGGSNRGAVVAVLVTFVAARIIISLTMVYLRLMA